MTNDGEFVIPDTGAFIPLVRTDYSTEEGWERAWELATEEYEDQEDYPRGGAQLYAIVRPEVLAGMSLTELAELPRAGNPPAFAVADAQTMEDGTIAFVDLRGPGREVMRSIPEQVETISMNLLVANLDFSDFLGAAGNDGIFRGWH